MARILVVEDNPTNLKLVTYLLSAFGHQPVAAHDGQECLDLLDRDAAFDLILCDIQMPRVSGYDVARTLKAKPHWRHIPLVAVTALAMVGDRDKVMAAGFDGYITKPITAETFIALVEAHLEPALRTAR